MIPAAFLMALASVAQPQTATLEKPVLDRYYQCMVDETFELEPSRERADLVARAVVHRCRMIFVDAARMLRVEKTGAARKTGLNPEDAGGFEQRFREYSQDYALNLIIGVRARRHN